MFKKTVYTVFLVSSLVVSNVSYAGMRCGTIGEHTNCSDEHGNYLRGHTDSSGRSSFYDNKGNNYRCYPGPGGVINCN
jgi:hypothetical protein